MPLEATTAQPASTTTTTVASPAAPNAPVTTQPADPQKPIEAQPKNGQKFAAMARREQRIRQQQADLKKVEAELVSKYERVQQFEKLQQAAKTNPLAVMKELGLTYEELTNFMLNGEKPTTDSQVDAVRAELENFKKQQIEERQKAIEAEKARLAKEDEEVTQAFHNEVAAFIKSSGDKYELINLYDQAQLVIDVIQTNFEKTGRLATKEEAAEHVENYLLGELEKATKTKKWLAKQQATTQQNPAAPAGQSLDARKARAIAAMGAELQKPEQKPSTEVTPRTLTNDHVATTAPSGTLTKEQRRARAIARLNGVNLT